eukprot:1158367-Pelagomonas_calceolata.AAC.1
MTFGPAPSRHKQIGMAYGPATILTPANCDDVWPCTISAQAKRVRADTAALVCLQPLSLCRLLPPY